MAILIGLVLFIHRESPVTLVSAHGLLHAAIAQNFVDAWGPVPPENPFFAGNPLPYYWFFHLVAGRLAGWTGLDLLHAFEMLILAAAAALVIGCGSLARALYGSRAPGLLIAFFTLAGSQPQAPLVLLWKWLRLDRNPFDDTGTYLWGVIHSATRDMRVGDRFGQLGPLLNYFLNITARPLALASLVGLLWMLRRTLERGDARNLCGLVLFSALLSAWSSLMALAAILSLCGALACAEFLRARGRVLHTEEPPHALPAMAGMLVGLALGAPTWWHLIGASGSIGVLSSGLSGAIFVVEGMTGSAWLLVLFAFWGIGRSSGSTRYTLAVLAIAALPCCLATALLQPPAGNHVNFFHVALVFFSVIAAAAFTRPGGALRPRASAVAVVCFLPMLMIFVWGSTGRPDPAIGIERGRLVRLPVRSELARAYAWLRDESEADAVVVIDPGPPTRAARGNVAELPALTGRSLFTEALDHYILAGHPDADARNAVARQLAAGAPLDAGGTALLAALERPVYVLCACEAGSEAADGLRAQGSREVFRSGSQAVFRWLGPRRS